MVKKRLAKGSKVCIENAQTGIGGIHVLSGLQSEWLRCDANSRQSTAVKGLKVTEIISSGKQERKLVVK